MTDVTDLAKGEERRIGRRVSWSSSLRKSCCLFGLFAMEEAIKADKKLNPSCNYSNTMERSCRAVSGDESSHESKWICKVIKEAQRFCPEDMAPTTIFTQEEETSRTGEGFGSSSDALFGFGNNAVEGFGLGDFFSPFPRSAPDSRRGTDEAEGGINRGQVDSFPSLGPFDDLAFGLFRHFAKGLPEMDAPGALFEEERQQRYRQGLPPHLRGKARARAGGASSSDDTNVDIPQGPIDQI